MPSQAVEPNEPTLQDVTESTHDMALSEEKRGSGRTGCPSSPRGGKISNTWSTDATKMNKASDEKCKPGQILQGRKDVQDAIL